MTVRLVSTVGAIEITDAQVRVVVIRTGGKRPRVLDLVAVDVVEAPDEPRNAYIVALRKALTEVTAKPAAFVLCVPSAWSVMRVLTVPFKNWRKVTAAIPFELEPHLAVPIDGLILDQVPVRQLDKSTEALVVGVRREPLELQLGICAEAGVHVEGVNIDAAGLTALYGALAGRGEGLEPIVHLYGPEPIFVLLRDGRVAYVRRLGIASERFVEDARVACREVQNILRSVPAAPDEPDPRSLAVTGRSVSETVQITLAQQLGLAVQETNLFDILEAGDWGGADGEDRAGPNVSRSEAEDFSACAGVALAAAGTGPSFNFLEDARDRGFRGVLPAAIITCFLAAAVLLAYLAYVLTDYRRNLAEAEGLGQEVWNHLRAVYPEAPQAERRPRGDIGGFRSLQSMQELATGEAQTGSTVSLSRFTQPTLLDVLDEIGSSMPEGQVKVTNIEVENLPRGGTEITVSGEVLNSGGYLEALEKFEASEVLRLDRTRERRQNIAGQETFTIVLRV